MEASFVGSKDRAEQTRIKEHRLDEIHRMGRWISFGVTGDGQDAGPPTYWQQQNLQERELASAGNTLRFDAFEKDIL
jgi:hypothetical protein